MAIYSGFSHEKWWFSIVMLVYQRVLRFGGIHSYSQLRLRMMMRMMMRMMVMMMMMMMMMMVVVVVVVAMIMMTVMVMVMVLVIVMVIVMIMIVEVLPVCVCDVFQCMHFIVHVWSCNWIIQVCVLIYYDMICGCCMPDWFGLCFMMDVSQKHWCSFFTLLVYL